MRRRKPRLAAGSVFKRNYMSLIKCSECGNEVSDKALSCPHCGNPGVSLSETVPVDKIPPERIRPEKPLAESGHQEKVSKVGYATFGVLVIAQTILHYLGWLGIILAGIAFIFRNTDRGWKLLLGGAGLLILKYILGFIFIGLAVTFKIKRNIFIFLFLIGMVLSGFVFMSLRDGCGIKNSVILEGKNGEYCTCKAGYIWNRGNTACVSLDDVTNEDKDDWCNKMFYPGSYWNGGIENGWPGCSLAPGSSNTLPNRTPDPTPIEFDDKYCKEVLGEYSFWNGTSCVCYPGYKEVGHGVFQCAKIQ